MTYRLAKINKQIQRIFGEVLQREADLPVGALITVTQVEVAENLRSAKVWLTVWPPEMAAKALRQLRKQMYDLQGAFNRAIGLQPLPRLKLLIDHGAEQAAKVDRILRELE